jgi:hypothetical protein
VDALADSNGCVGNDAAVSIYDGYYDDLKVLYMVGIQNRKMAIGARAKFSVFSWTSSPTATHACNGRAATGTTPGKV